ncbi:hypothetical protein PR048_004148, partial [Dryococelus australis]
MSSREAKKQCKVAVLQKIKEKKNVLFAWTDVSNLAHSLGLLLQEKGWEYVQEGIWQNWKKVAMAKVDNRRQTGSGEGTVCKFSELDLIVLDIVGKDSPLVTSLGVQETWQSQDASCSVVNETTVQPSAESDLPELSATEEQRDSSGIPVAPNDFFEKKWMLQLEYLKLQNYKTKLEILKLETDDTGQPIEYTIVASDNIEIANETVVTASEKE